MAGEKGRQTGPVSPPDPLAEMTARELQSLIDEELARLPEMYRHPLLLCCVQGLSREEAARQMGWSDGAVKGCLERGRRQLAARLAERGVALSTLLLAPLAAEAVPAALVARTTALAAAPWSPCAGATAFLRKESRVRGECRRAEPKAANIIAKINADLLGVTSG